MTDHQLLTALLAGSALLIELAIIGSTLWLGHRINRIIATLSRNARPSAGK